MKISCKIIEDLIPLYFDKVCSEESSKMIEDHIRECAHCSQILKDLRTETSINCTEIEENIKSSTVLGGFINKYKKSIFKAFINGLITSAIIFSFIIGIYYSLFDYQGSIVPKDQVSISGYMIGKNQISFKLEPLDGYCGGNIKTSIDEDGNLYIAIYRTFIKERLREDENEIMNYGFNQSIKNYNAVYYGTPGEAKLLWKNGQTLPKATEDNF